MKQADDQQGNPPPTSEEDISKQVEAAKIGMDKYKEALRALAKH